jgi:hypothetical protein
MKSLLKLPKFIIAMAFLAIFYLIETVLMIIYLIVETPMSWLLDRVESIIKYLVKNI